MCANTLTWINRNPIKYNHKFAPITHEFARINLVGQIREIHLVRENSWFNFSESDFCHICTQIDC